MITPHLERLIWEGKAAFKTFVAGGGQKCVLPIPDDHFIIITDLTYFNSLMLPEVDTEKYSDMVAAMITQVNIFSDKNFNRFIFRNNFTQARAGTTAKNFPFGNTHHDVYLIHQNKGISFTFSYGEAFTSNINGTVQSQQTTLKPPLDYGAIGDPGAIFVSAQMSTADWEFVPVNCVGTFNANARELSFPVNAATNIPFTNRSNQFQYPFIQVGYVVIKGIPTDFGFK